MSYMIREIVNKLYLKMQGVHKTEEALQIESLKDIR